MTEQATEVYEVRKPDDCRYMTVAESLWANCHRHMQNAKRHMAAGRSDYAAGSMRKAYRNFERGRRVAFDQQGIPLSVALTITHLADAVAESML